AVPMPDGISHPCRIEVFWVRTPVRGDYAEKLARFVEDHNLLRRLHDLYGIRLVDRIRHSARQAMLTQRKRIVGTDFIFLRPGLKRDFADRLERVKGRDIDSREVGLAVGCARHWPARGWLAGCGTLGGRGRRARNSDGDRTGILARAAEAERG